MAHWRQSREWNPARLLGRLRRFHLHCSKTARTIEIANAGTYHRADAAPWLLVFWLSRTAVSSHLLLFVQEQRKNLRDIGAVVGTSFFLAIVFFAARRCVGRLSERKKSDQTLNRPINGAPQLHHTKKEAQVESRKCCSQRVLKHQVKGTTRERQ